VETTYEFLRWEDIIRRDFKRPAWWAILFSLRTLIFSIFSGAYPRILHAHWRFGFFLAYPFVVLTGLLLASAMAGGIAAEIVTIVTAAPMAAALLGFAAACATFFALLKMTEPITYMTYIFQDAASTVQYANRQRPDWEERLEAFAGYVVEAARAVQPTKSSSLATVPDRSLRLMSLRARWRATPSSVRMARASRC